MSQRIHSCTNNTNLDTIQCDAYASKLYPKHDKMRNIPTKSIHTKGTRDIMPLHRQMNLGLSPRTNRQSTSQLSKPESLVRKELYADNAALVEVTVKTHNAAKSKTINANNGSKQQQQQQQETWGKILKTQTSKENITSFRNFDPLRTIHFLAKELQCKLQQTKPNDITVLQMVAEMQKALNRVPPDVSSSAALIQTKNHQSPRVKCDMRPTKLKANDMLPILEVIKPPVHEIMTQTPRNMFMEPSKLQQHLEESSEKIERACMQMEMLCAQLKAEKEDLEGQLNAEKEKCKSLNKQIEEQKIKQHATSALVESLQGRNDELEMDVKRLRTQIEIETKQGPTSHELKTFVQQLQHEKCGLEEECMQLKHQLTVAIMEHEKYEAILQARDSQVREIKNEMAALQEVVNEQLLEFQNPMHSDTSITNTTTSHSDAADKSMKDSEQTLSTINSTMTKVEVDAYKIQQVPSVAFKGTGDSSISTSEGEHSKKSKFTSLRSEKSSKKLPQAKIPDDIREKFDEIKRQALACSPPQTNNN